MIIQTLLKNSLLNNLTIKVISLIIGYSIWSFFATSYTVHEWKNVPVCFYNNENKIIESNHEYVTIKLAGKRADLNLCKDLALHIDAQTLAARENFIIPNESSFFLPSNVKLLYCNTLKVSVRS